MESGMPSQSSPVSMLFLARSFIFARLTRVSRVARELVKQANALVLEPYLDRTFSHINILSNAFSDAGRGRRVLVELDLEGEKLVLGRALPLLILLLLRQRTLPWGAPRSWVGAVRRGRGRGRRRGRALPLRPVRHVC
jgi:hypothetical protein